MDREIERARRTLAHELTVFRITTGREASQTETVWRLIDDVLAAWEADRKRLGAIELALRMAAVECGIEGKGIDAWVNELIDEALAPAILHKPTQAGSPRRAMRTT